MSVSTIGALAAAFNKVQPASLTRDNKQQLDALIALVDDIAAEGTFAAKLDAYADALFLVIGTPEIKDALTREVSFTANGTLILKGFLGYAGRDIANNGNGFNLLDDAGRQLFLETVGTAVAHEASSRTLRAEALRHVQTAQQKK